MKWDQSRPRNGLTGFQHFLAVMIKKSMHVENLLQQKPKLNELFYATIATYEDAQENSTKKYKKNEIFVTREGKYIGRTSAKNE